MAILDVSEADFTFSVDVLVIGGGACGLCAGLAASSAGAQVLILEQDATPLGTSAMSTGLIPAAGTSAQHQAGVVDSPELFAHDICSKSRFRTDEKIVLTLAGESAKTIEWLTRDHYVPLTLVESFLYPGHSVKRMHGMPNRSGAELMGSLCNAIEREDIALLTNARVTILFADDDGRVRGARYVRPDGKSEDVACDAVVLACCGFAGNSEMLNEFIPEITDGVFFGHSGNKGDAILWGVALGAATADMSAYQGHGGLAKGFGIPILWPCIVEGGIQINVDGERFSDESRGYSEQAVDVLQQDGASAWTFYDEQRHQLMLEFDDYKEAVAAGAVRSADTLSEIAMLTKLPIPNLSRTLADIAIAVETKASDRFGRSFEEKNLLTPPYYAVQVTGAIFHTQGGLKVDGNGRVLREDGSLLPNLFAGGGAARGISGPDASGYLAGNGLLTATTYGRLAGTAAANISRQEDLKPKISSRVDVAE